MAIYLPTILCYYTHRGAQASMASAGALSTCTTHRRVHRTSTRRSYEHHQIERHPRCSTEPGHLCVRPLGRRTGLGAAGGAGSTATGRGQRDFHHARDLDAGKQPLHNDGRCHRQRRRDADYRAGGGGQGAGQQGVADSGPPGGGGHICPANHIHLRVGQRAQRVGWTGVRRGHGQPAPRDGALWR